MSDVEPGPPEAEGIPPASAGPEVLPSAPVEGDGGRVCEVALEEFEGPLDLLLHLVRRHELDILDIPISFVCEKYLEYIDFMHALDLEVAGDYLVMAATLAYLKSRELVPQQDELAPEGTEEDGPDPREQLIMRLLEYQKFKDAATRLDQRPIAGRDTFGRGQEVELPPLDSGLAPITLFRLAEAYSRVLERARIHKSHEVVMETISVASRMEQLTGVLISRSRFEFEALFLEREWGSEAELRSMLVVTLMSVLELVRMGIASVHQPVGSETIVVERVASEAEAREALRGYDESLSFGDGTESTPKAEEGASEDDDAAVDKVVAEAVANEGVTATDGEPGAGIESAANEAGPVERPDGAETVDAARAEDGAEERADDVEPFSEEARADAAESVREDASAEEAEPASEDESVEAAEPEPSDRGSNDQVEAPAPTEDPRADEPQGGPVHPEFPTAAEIAAAEAPTRTADPSPPGEEGAQVPEPVDRSAASEATDGASDSDSGSSGSGAGVSGRSVVSESPPVGAAHGGVDEAAPSPERADGAPETTEGDGQEHGENGEAEEVEGS